MDLAYTESENAFRDEARAWLAAHCPAHDLPSFDTATGFEAHRQWEQTLYSGRWSAVSWPREYGGRDANLVEWLIFEEEYHRAEAPARVNQNGVFLLAPTLLEYASAQQKERLLAPTARSDIIWAQAWSEPDAGSDLAAMRARAEPVAGGYRVSGQKIWSTRAAYADWCFGLFRSQSDSQRHRGLTFLLIPLSADGITVRPIRQLDGEAGFAEIFFDDVFVADSNRVGEDGEGWRIAMATAGFERGLMLRSPARYQQSAKQLLELVDRLGDEVTAGQREQAEQIWMDAEAYCLATYQTVGRLRSGERIGAEASANKIFWSELDLRLHALAMELLGSQACVNSAHSGLGTWMKRFLFSLAGPIYAGTNDIQRNILAERLLGLPRLRPTA